MYFSKTTLSYSTLVANKRVQTKITVVHTCPVFMMMKVSSRTNLSLLQFRLISISSKSILFTLFTYWVSGTIAYFLDVHPHQKEIKNSYLNWRYPLLPQLIAAIISLETSPYIAFLQYSCGILHMLPIVRAL